MQDDSKSSLARLPMKDLVDVWRDHADELGHWWLSNGTDPNGGGIIGEIGVDGTPDQEAPKNVIAQARMCWFFSEMYNTFGDPSYNAAATTIRDFVLDHYLDSQNEGFGWKATASGDMVEPRKHAYAHAFVLYALSAHVRATGDAVSLEHAQRLFATMERRFKDHVNGGYLEAFSWEWGPIPDVRLSDEDLSSPKSANTHLHILEAYSEFYLVDSSEPVGHALRDLINLHLCRIFDSNSSHLRLFWTTDWIDQSVDVSFGHDIEASWLIWRAVDRLGEADLRAKAQPIVMALADATLSEASGPNGEIYNERSLKDGYIDEARVWWVQAEGMVGHLNAFELSGQTEHLRRVAEIWTFIERYVVQKEVGEWSWYSSLDVQASPYLTGPWKTAYHNGRALLECITRSERIFGV